MSGDNPCTKVKSCLCSPQPAPPLTGWGWRQGHYLVALATATVIWVAGTAFTGLATNNPDFFHLKSTIGNVSDYYGLQVTPAGFTFAIWGLIYAWQALWILYAWTFVIRFKTVPTVPPSALWLYAAANLFPPVWTVLWSDFLPIPSLPVLMATPFIQYFALWRIHSYFLTNLGTFHKADVVVCRLLVHNGVAFYTTWVSIAWQLNLGVVLQYIGGVDPTVVGALILASTALQSLVLFFLEQTVFRQALKFTHSIYPVVAWATLGACVKHWDDPDNPLKVFALLLCLLSVALAILHVAVNVACWAWGLRRRDSHKPPADKAAFLRDVESYHADQ